MRGDGARPDRAPTARGGPGPAIAPGSRRDRSEGSRPRGVSAGYINDPGPRAAGNRGWGLIRGPTRGAGQADAAGCFGIGPPHAGRRALTPAR